MPPRSDLRELQQALDAAVQLAVSISAGERCSFVAQHLLAHLSGNAPPKATKSTGPIPSADDPQMLALAKAIQTAVNEARRFDTSPIRRVAQHLQHIGRQGHSTATRLSHSPRSPAQGKSSKPGTRSLAPPSSRPARTGKGKASPRSSPRPTGLRAASAKAQPSSSPSIEQSSTSSSPLKDAVTPMAANASSSILSSSVSLTIEPAQRLSSPVPLLVPFGPICEDPRERYVETRGLWRALVETDDIVMLSASWLVDHARVGGTLPPRASLPVDASVSPELVEEYLREMEANGMCNDSAASAYEIGVDMTFPPLLAVALLWWDSEHPDPDGMQLRLLADALEWYVSERCRRHVGRRDAAVFIDFSSLHSPRTRSPHGGGGANDTHSEGGASGAVESVTASYSRALAHLDVLYAHTGVVKMLLSSVAGAPAHCRDAFHARAWPAYASAAASLLSPPKHVLDISRLSRRFDGRLTVKTDAECAAQADYQHDLCPGTLGELMGAKRPPRSPAAFRRWLQQVRSGGEALCHVATDEGVVGALHSAVTLTILKRTETLDLDHLGWGDDEIEVGLLPLRTWIPAPPHWPIVRSAASACCTSA